MYLVKRFSRRQTKTTKMKAYCNCCCCLKKLKKKKKEESYITHLPNRFHVLFEGLFFPPSHC